MTEGFTRNPSRAVTVAKEEIFTWSNWSEKLPTFGIGTKCVPLMFEASHNPRMPATQLLLKRKSQPIWPPYAQPSALKEPRGAGGIGAPLLSTQVLSLCAQP